MKNSHIRMASIGLVTFSLAACRRSRRGRRPSIAEDHLSDRARAGARDAARPGPKRPGDHRRRAGAPHRPARAAADDPLGDQGAVPGGRVAGTARAGPARLGDRDARAARGAPPGGLAEDDRRRPSTPESARGGPARGPARRRPRGRRIDDGQGEQGRRVDGGQPLRRHPHRARHGRQGEAARDVQRLPGRSRPIGRGSRTGTCIEEVDGAIPRAWRCETSSTACAATRGPTSRSRCGSPRRRPRGRSRSPAASSRDATIVGIREQTSGDSKLRLEGPDPIGYLKITEITASTPHELRKLARRMESEGIRALVLDLRGARSGGACRAPGRPAGRQPAGARDDRARPDGPRRDDLPGRSRRPVPRLADRRARRSEYVGHRGMDRGGAPGQSPGRRRRLADLGCPSASGCPSRRI